MIKLVGKALLATIIASITTSSNGLEDESFQGGKENLIQLHKKKLDTQTEKSTILEVYQSGELRKKRDYGWKQTVQLIVHLTDVTFLPDLLRGFSFLFIIIYNQNSNNLIINN